MPNLLLRCLFLFVLLPATSHAADWFWVAGQTGTAGWDVQEGKAEVTVDDGKFNARLFGKDGSRDPLQTLAGTVQGRKLSARRTIFGSDVPAEPMSGTIASMQQGPYRHTTLILANDWGFVALTRDATPPAAGGKDRRTPGRKGP